MCHLWLLLMLTLFPILWNTFMQFPFFLKIISFHTSLFFHKISTPMAFLRSISFIASNHYCTLLLHCCVNLLLHTSPLPILWLIWFRYILFLVCFSHPYHVVTECFLLIHWLQLLILEFETYWSLLQCNLTCNTCCIYSRYKFHNF